MTIKRVTYYRCDRCKRNWRDNPNMRSITYGGWDDDNYKRDLCPDCSREFERFWEGTPLAEIEEATL